MARRFDYVEVRSPYTDPNTGALVCSGTIARSGIQEYRQPDGSVVREFRPPDEVAKSADSFSEKIITLDHPPVMLNPENSREYQRGFSGQAKFASVANVINCKLNITDAEAIQAAQTTHRQLSNGYDCDIDETPGEYEGQPYDRVQRNIRGNHIALVERARAGNVAVLHLDSVDADDIAISTRFDSEEISFVVDEHRNSGNSKHRIQSFNRKPMTTIRIDSVEYPVQDAALAAAVSGKINELSQQTKRADAAETLVQQLQYQIDSLTSQVEVLDESANAERGRADAAEEKLAELIESVNAEFESNEGDEAGEEEDLYTLEEVAEAIEIGIAEGIDAREGAVELLVAHGVDPQSIHFDSYDPIEIKASVVEILQPGARFDTSDPVRYEASVQARYDSAWEQVVAAEMEDGEEDESDDEYYRQDSNDYISLARQQVAANRVDGKEPNRRNVGLDAASLRKMDACKQPLSVSKGN